MADVGEGDGIDEEVHEAAVNEGSSGEAPGLGTHESVHLHEGGGDAVAGEELQGEDTEIARKKAVRGGETARARLSR